MIVVVGASGDLGGRIVRQLRAIGRPVRAVGRHRERLQPLTAVGATVYPADLRVPATLGPACAGATVVVSTANAVVSKERGNTVLEVDVRGNRALVDAAKSVGVQKLVFVSARGATATHPADFFRAKAATEAHLKASGLGWVIVSAAAFMEVWGTLLGDPVFAGKTVTLFGKGQNPAPYVASDDVARITAALAADANVRNEVVDVGGPENLTAEQVVETFERVAGRSAHRRYVPRAMLALLSTLLRPVNPVLSRLMRASLWSDTADLRFESAPLEARFGRLVRLEDFARQRLAARPPAPS
jgi:uncharacterized protein YbjT (DUF2867 family)